MTTMLNNEQAAAVIGCTPKTLNYWRHKGKGPKFVKFGTHRNAGVRYDLADIEAWKEANTFASTSAYSAAARASVSARNGNLPPAQRVKPSRLQPTL